MFRIGSYWLPPSYWISDQQYSGFPAITHRCLPTGLSPCCVLRSRRVRIQREGETRSTPHISRSFLAGIRFVLFPFRSPLLRESLLLSFPAGTKMFQFPASPFTYVNACARSLIQVCRVHSLYATTPAFSQLTTPLKTGQPVNRIRLSSFLRSSSQAIHHIPCLVPVPDSQLTLALFIRITHL